jgi:hypothetical protein
MPYYDAGLAHATRTAAGMTRIIAADVVREARRRYAVRGSS